MDVDRITTSMESMPETRARVIQVAIGVAIGIALNNILGFNQSLRILVEGWTQLDTSLGAIARLEIFESTVLLEDKPGEYCIPHHSRGRIEDLWNSEPLLLLMGESFAFICLGIFWYGVCRRHRP